LDRQRRTAGEPYARAVAGAHVLIDAELLLYGPLSRFDPLTQLRRNPPLPVELAFALRDQHLRAGLGGRERLAQRAERGLHVVGMHAPHPGHADTADRLLDWITHLPFRNVGPGGEDVLAAGRRRVAIVDDDGETVVAVEHGVADAAREAVVPEPAIAHQRHRPGAGRAILECSRTRGAEPVTHDAGAEIERRERRKGVATDVGADVHGTALALNQLH